MEVLRWWSGRPGSDAPLYELLSQLTEQLARPKGDQKEIS